MINYKDIITEAKKILNVPFCHFGRSRLGLDCAGVVYITHNRCGMNLQSIDQPYDPFWWKKTSQGERILNGFINTWKFEYSDEPVIGGLILFRIYGKNVPVNHCGILINENEFIHAKCGIGRKINKVVIEDLNYGYGKRIACYMKHGNIDYGWNDHGSNRR